MAKIDISNALKKAGDTAKKAKDKAVSAAQEGAQKAQAGAKALKDATKKEVDKISESITTSVDQRKAEKSQKEAGKKAAAEKAAIESTGVKAIAPQNALKIFYFLIAADREIASAEEDKFDQIGRKLDTNFDEHKSGIISECKNRLEKIIDPEDYYDALQDGVEAALSEEQISDIGFMTPKLLIWDLMTIAYSDKEYDETERRLLKYIVRKLDIAKDVFLEMETSLLTINDIERELSWIKTTDRPYLEIENQVRELDKRRDDILLAIKALIVL